MPNEIKGYETRDGKVFKKYRDAIEHEQEIELAKLLAEHYGGQPLQRRQWAATLIVELSRIRKFHHILQELDDYRPKIEAMDPEEAPKMKRTA